MCKCCYDLIVLVVAISSLCGGAGVIVCGIVFPNEAITIGGGESAKAGGLIAFGVYFFLAGLFGMW